MRFLRSLFLCVGVLTLAACGGGGADGDVDGSGGNTPTQATAPAATIVFPPVDGSLTSGDTLFVRGTATGAGGVTSLR